MCNILVKNWSIGYSRKLVFWVVGGTDSLDENVVFWGISCGKAIRWNKCSRVFGETGVV